MSTTSLPKIIDSGSSALSNQRVKRALIVGTTSAALRLARDLQSFPQAQILPVAFLGDISSETGSVNETPLPVAGTLRDLPVLIHKEAISVIFLTDDSETIEEAVRNTVSQSGGPAIQVYRIRSFYENVLQKIPSVCINDTWFRQESGFRLLTSRADAVAKRMFDMLFGVLLFLLTAPVMLLAALAVRVDSPGSILYSQIRTGQNGRPFRVYKFRSMYRDAEQFGAKWASECDPRITRVGRFLRATRIDELPQLWNVLKGEMSLIGPRPERPEFDTTLAEQIPHYQTRYRIKPGLSGWAQVMYPYGASVDDAREKLAYDLYYIKNCSALLDMLITWKTVQVVLFRKGR